MPDPISWYALGRDVNDPQTILEAVDEKILAHNLDPSAHGQSDEAVYMHRIATVLDHVNYSINNLKIGDIAIDNRTIKEINAYKINAGILIAKDGVNYAKIITRDTLDRDIVVLDTSGITINYGKMTIKDDNSQVIIDAKGIKGSTSFTATVAQKDNDQAIGGDHAFVDISDLSFSFNFNRDTPVLFYGCVRYEIGGADATPEFRIKYGSSYFPADGWNANTPQNDWFMYAVFSFTHLLTIPSGSQTVSLQAARSTPDENLTILGENDTSTFGYLILGT